MQCKHDTCTYSSHRRRDSAVLAALEMSSEEKQSPQQQKSSLTTPRTKRHALSLEERCAVLRLIEEGKSQRKIAKILGVSKTQIQNIQASRSRINQAVKDPIVPRKSKITTVKSKHPQLDKAVYEWFCRMRNPPNRCKPMPISRAAIQARAKREAMLRGIDKFTASDGWFARWRWRFGVGSSVRLHGEAGDVNIETAEKLMQVIRNKLAEGCYPLDHIFNMDETGLFYRAIPKRSYILEGCDTRQQRYKEYECKGASDTCVMC